MTVAFGTILLLLVQSSFLRGMLLLPPQNVTLTSENFYTFLAWRPAPGSTSSTQYEVERHNGNRSSPGWIKEPSCRRGNLKVIQRCELNLPDLYTRYYARVRALDGPWWSNWTNSNTLQLYKDIIGPLNLSLVVADHDLTVSVTMPQTPLKRSENTKIMQVMQILVTLCRDNETIHQVKVRYSLGRMSYTFENTEPNVNYCVKASVIHQPAKEAVQCIKKTPGSRADNAWVPFAIASLILGGFVLLVAVGTVALKHYIAAKHSEILLPQSLTFLDPNLLVLRAVLSLDEDPVAPLSAVCFVSHHDILEERERGPSLSVPGGCNTQRLSVYCANSLHWESLGAEGTAVLSGAGGDTLSSGGSGGEECSTEENSGTAPGCLELSVSPSPAAEGLQLHSMGTGAWELARDTGNKSGEVRWPTWSTRTNVLLDSLKLPNVLDLQGLKHESYLPMEECHAFPEARIQHITGSLAHQEQCGLRNDMEGPPGSNPERKDASAMKFPGYELHPLIRL